MQRFRLWSICLAMSVALNSAATDAASPGPPMLSAVNVESQTGSSLVAVHFFPQVPLYNVSTENPTTFDLQFPDVAIAPGLERHIAVSGSIRSVGISSIGHILVVRVISTVPATLNIVRLRNELDVNVITGQGYTSVAQRTAAPNFDVSRESRGTTTLVSLRFADIDEVVQVLTGQAPAVPDSSGLLGQAVSPFSQPSGGFNGGAGGLVSAVPPMSLGAPVPLAQHITDRVSIDRRLNSIVLTGTMQENAAAMDLIKQLDVPDAPTASVEMDTEIVELTESAARDVGLDFSNNNASALGSFHASAFNLPQSDVEIQAQLFAQLAAGNGKLLAKPRIQTLSGTAASILTGDALPILTTIVYPGSPPTVQQQLQYVNVGVRLQVQPFVSGSGFVTTRVITEVSNVTGFISGNVPQISERQAVATARVRDGQPFIVGGLLQDNDLESMSKLPLLGDIPLIGLLFRTVHTSHKKTNLYVVVTPHIIKSE